MRKLALVAACSLLAFPVFAATVGEKTGINSALGISPTTKDFVSEAAISDMFEIQSSQLASSKLSGAEKGFASQMITDHTKTSSELSSQAKAAGVAVPTAMDSSHREMLDKLKGLNGDAFRKQYFSDQVSGHETAVSLFQRYSSGGSNAKLKSWAGATLPILKHHLAMARALYKKT